MAWWLVEEMMDHAPRHLTPSQRHLLAVLAELCRGDGRHVSESLDYVAWRYGTSASGVKQALRAMAAAGVDVRVALGVDKNGNPVYAVRGRVPTFRLPVFPAPEGCPCRRCEAVHNPVDNSPEGGSIQPPTDVKGAESRPEGGSNQPPNPPEGGSNQPPSRSLSGDTSSSLARNARELAAEIGASDEEMRTLIEQAKTAGARSPVSWLRTLHANGDLTDWLTDLRGRPPVELRPPWCGQCLEATRRMEDADGRDVGRCPRCHPLRDRNAA